MHFVRRSLLTVLTLGALALPVDGTSQVSLGLNAGVSLASFSVDDVEGIDTKIGALAGAYLAFPLSDLFSIAPGLYYVQKGAKVQEFVAGESFESALELAYLEVPLLGVFTVTGADRPIGVSLFLGPSIAFEVSCGLEGESPAVLFSGDCEEEDVSGAEVDRKKVDVGAIFGAGVSVGFSDRVDFIVNGGLDMGLTSLDQPVFVGAVVPGGPVRDVEGKNSVWFVTAGVRFPLGG